MLKKSSARSRGVVEIAAHEREFGQIGCGLVILNPEEGGGLTAAVAEIAADHERTEGFNLRTEGAGVLIEVDAFLNIIAFHVFGGEVGVVDAHLAVVGLVEDVVVVHDLLSFHDVLFRRNARWRRAYIRRR